VPELRQISEKHGLQKIKSSLHESTQYSMHPLAQI